MYSIAIRTLGTNGEIFRRELVSIVKQTIEPERVVVYIGKDCPIPQYRIGKEEYVTMTTGMVAQRAHDYAELTSEYILLLDDDVELSSDTAERLLNAARQHRSDCVGGDAYRTHQLPVLTKVYALLTNLVCPRPDDGWAFKVRRSGSFSYNNYPRHGGYYPTQYCAGPVALWRREALLSIHLEDELWLDQLGFAYSDDLLESYKLHCNHFSVGLLYDAGVTNLDGQSASRAYRSSVRRYYVRSMASFLIWHRSHYALKTNRRIDRILDAGSFSVKAVWLFGVNVLAGVAKCNAKVPYYYLKGLCDGLAFVRSSAYRSLRNYIVK